MDLADEFFLYTLAGHDIGRLEAVRHSKVKDALLWRYLMRYSRYLEEEELKRVKNGR